MDFRRLLKCPFLKNITGNLKGNLNMVSFQSFKIEIIYLVFILLLRFLETIQATSRVRRNTCRI